MNVKCRQVSFLLVKVVDFLNVPEEGVYVSRVQSGVRVAAQFIKVSLKHRKERQLFIECRHNKGFFLV